jgi:hypothetical protein
MESVNLGSNSVELGGVKLLLGLEIIPSVAIIAVFVGHGHSIRSNSGFELLVNLRGKSPVKPVDFFDLCCCPLARARLCRQEGYAQSVSRVWAADRMRVVNLSSWWCHCTLWV